MGRNKTVAPLNRVERTPLVEVDGAKTVGYRLLAKCEFLNPTGSHKDRMYAFMVDRLERDGVIQPGQRLIDYSSGNAGAALAFVGARRAYPVTIVRPAGLSRAKAQQIVSLGAQLVLTSAEQGVAGARQAATDFASELGAGGFLMHQAECALNTEAFITCGREIVETLHESGLEAHAFVCGIGTGGTFSGVAQAIKEAFPGVLLVAGEVDGSSMLSLRAGDNQGTGLTRPHHLEGLSPGILFGNTRQDLVTRVELCSEADAWLETLELERQGFLVGPSSGFNAAIARRLASRELAGANVVTVFFDAGWKYYAERDSWLQNLGILAGTREPLPR